MKIPFIGQSRRDENQEQAEDSTPKAPGGLSVSHLAFLSLLLVLGVIAALVAHNYRQDLGQQAAASAEVDRAETRRLAGALAGRLAVYSEQLGRFAAEPALVTAMGDGEAQQAAAARLRQLLPGVIRVRFLRPGEDEVDESTTPALSYACLELAAQVEQKGAPAPLEVHRMGTEDQHIDLIHPLSGEQGPVGTLLVSLDVSEIKGWLATLRPDGGYAELQQGDLRLGTVGQAAAKGASAPLRAPVAGSAWQVAYWPPTAGRGGALEATQMAFAIQLAAAAGAVILIFLFYILLLKRLLRSDLVALTKQVVNLVGGRRDESLRLRLAEFRAILQAFELRLKEQLAGRPAVQPVPEQENKTPVPGEEAEEPSGVMYLDEDTFAVEEVDEAEYASEADTPSEQDLSSEGDKSPQGDKPSGEDKPSAEQEAAEEEAGKDEDDHVLEFKPSGLNLEKPGQKE